MVDSNDLLTALGRVVRERERDDVVATEPVHAASSEPLVDAIVAELTSASLRDASASEVNPNSASASQVNVRPGTVKVFEPRRKLWFGLPALAAAAGLSLLLGRGMFDAPDATAVLPAYAAEFDGSVATVRGVEQGNDKTLTLAPGAELTVLLRPREPVTGAVYANVGVASVTDPTTFELVAARTVAAASGSMRVNFTASTELPTRGTVCVVVARAEGERSKFVDVSEKGDGWQRFCWSFVRVGVDSDQ